PCVVVVAATPTPAPCPLSLRDALPIFGSQSAPLCAARGPASSPRCPWPRCHDPRGSNGCSCQSCCHRSHRDPVPPGSPGPGSELDRKSTRLNSSHVKISYAVFCLKKKK